MQESRGQAAGTEDRKAGRAERQLKNHEIVSVGKHVDAKERFCLVLRTRGRRRFVTS